MNLGWKGYWKKYGLSYILIGVALLLILLKIILGINQSAAEKKNLWRVQVTMTFDGKGKPAHVKLMLPKSDPRQKIYKEHFSQKGLSFETLFLQKGLNRMGVWGSESLDGSKSVYYTFSTHVRGARYSIPKSVTVAQQSKRYPQNVKRWLKSSKHIQSDDPEMKQALKRIIGFRRDVSSITHNIYDFVRGEVQYRSEKGSKDAQETLKAMVADCGGKARLFTALSRAAGIPSRVVGGVILKNVTKKETHVWCENFLDGRWVPFDVTNNHYGVLPNDFLVIYRDDLPLILRKGVENFQYQFVIQKERIPPFETFWSLYNLPIHLQKFINFLLLIPLGALIVAFLRTIVGILTFGTFAPILLAATFYEVSLLLGLISFSVIVGIGVLLRIYLDRHKVLFIPRLSMVLTSMVLLVLILMVFSYHLGVQRTLHFSFFPMIILTWTIERFSIAHIEDGLKTALITAAGTALASAIIYGVMQVHTILFYLFSFPELLLVIMALLFFIGQYTGYRLTELWRFRDIIFKRK